MNKNVVIPVKSTKTYDNVLDDRNATINPKGPKTVTDFGTLRMPSLKESPKIKGTA